MSVTGAGAFDYDDVEHQVITTATASNPDDNDNYRFEIDYEPLSGALSRGEAAELLFGRFQVLIDPANPKTPVGHTHIWISFGTENQPVSGPGGFDRSTVRDETAVETNPDTATGGVDIPGAVWDHLSAGTWFHATPHAQSGLEDQTNGVGAGMWTHMHHEEFHPKEMLGVSRGPLVFRDDELREHLIVHADNANPTVYRNYNLYWKVHELRDVDDLLA